MPNKLDNSPADKIKFLQYHKPALADGKYEITLTQKIQGEKIKENGQPVEPFSTKKTFFVSGERFELKPTDIHAVFPPAGSLGEHANVLPHIILNRSTLPWERSVDPKDSNGNDTPWLFLLLFEDEEKPTPQVIPLQKLKNPESGGGKFPQILEENESEPNNQPFLRLEPGQRVDNEAPDKITIIDIKKNVLKNLIPSKNDLQLIAHVRQTQDFKVTDQTLRELKVQKVPDDVLIKLTSLKDQEVESEDEFLTLLGTTLGDEPTKKYNIPIFKYPLNSTELAVIIGNRLPKKGGVSTIHLVSVEGRYYNSNEFNYQGAGDDDLIRLVSLKNWSFACLDEESYKITENTIKKLESPDKDVIEQLISLQNQVIRGTQQFLEALKLDDLEDKLDPEKIKQYKSSILKYAFYTKQTFKGLLTHLNRTPSTLRLPPNNNPEAEKYLASGYIPLPHYLRQGDKTISWYHSPLIPGENTTDITLPIRAADELVRYNPANGMFDISYAAAWELGRLLALQSKDFSINFYNWKRTHVQQLKQAEQKLIHLPTFSQQAEDTIKIPDAIASWFKDLSLLKGVPFNYLVPDERMLPLESIRFFWVDSQWIECLLDGAFSIGRVTDSEHERDKARQSPAANPHEKVSGFLLRSAVVAGWPGLLVDGYSKVIDNDDRVSSADQLKLLRMERLSANVLLCLFNGEVKTVDIHQKPETLHFGLDSDDGNTNFYKELRDSQGNKNGKKIDPIPWSNKNKRVINITQLANNSQQPSTSAQFAFEMIEGVERVRFKKMDT